MAKELAQIAMFEIVLAIERLWFNGNFWKDSRAIINDFDGGNNRATTYRVNKDDPGRYFLSDSDCVANTPNPVYRALRK